MGRYIRFGIAIGLGLMLAACGGGGSGDQPPASYTVSTNAGANGSIIPASASVTQGGTASFSITPGNGFIIDTASGCGGSLAGNTYTTGPISGDCTVTVSFSSGLAAVSPLYPVNGANWNDYVKHDGASRFAATDTATDGTETGGYSAVVHGGEMRVVELAGKNSCNGLTAQDELGVFDWVCVDTSIPVRVISSGLKPDKHLSDLIDFSAVAWRTNRVTVYDNSVIYAQTPRTTWWGNTINVDNDGSDGTDMTEGEVRIVTANPRAGYILRADKVALVIDPSIALTGTGSSNSNLIYSANYRHLWLEGSVDASGDFSGISLNETSFSVLRNMRVVQGNTGIQLSNSTNNFIFSVTTSDAISTGISMYLSTHNSLSRIASNGNSTGINLNYADNNTLSEVMASSNEEFGISMYTSNNTVLKDILVADNVNVGLYMYNSDYNKVTQLNAAENHSVGVMLTGVSGHNTLSQSIATNSYTGIVIDDNANNNVLVQVTTTNNAIDGLYVSTKYNVLLGVTANQNTTGIELVGASRNNMILQAVAANNGTGIRLQDTSNNTLSRLTAAHNSYNLYLENASNNTFSELLQVGASQIANCTVLLGTNPGLNSDCSPQGSSSFVLTGDIALADSFVGKITQDDATNTSDSNGGANYPIDTSSFDWVHFENPLRAWGIDGYLPFPHNTNAGLWNGGSGRIWDWSLRSTDAVIRNAFSTPLNGNVPLTHTWLDYTTTTFLLLALEVTGDGVGNENGLCESAEVCISMPNYGSYQGHGPLTSAGTFTDGAISNVVLMKYETNGR